MSNKLIVAVILLGIWAHWSQTQPDPQEARIQVLENQYTELLTMYHDMSQTQIVLLELMETQEVR